MRRLGSCSMNWKNRAARAMVALALALVALYPASAFAEDSESPDPNGDNVVKLDDEANVVDPAQRADNSFIYDTTIESLFSQSSLYDGRTVQVVGEAIGDTINDDIVGVKRQWVTLTSTDAGNPTTISLLISTDQAAQIDHLGRYGVTGTILQVRGTYHQACSEHDGIPDIHVTASSVLARGVEHPDLFELDQFLPGLLAVALGLVLMGVYYFVRERSR